MLAKEKERDSETTQRRQLEKALDELRQAMAAKTSEDAKRDQAEKSRESELARLRDEKSQLQQQLQAQNESAQALAGKLRTEFEVSRRSMSRQTGICEPRLRPSKRRTRSCLGSRTTWQKRISCGEESRRSSRLSDSSSKRLTTGSMPSPWPEM